MTWWVCALGYVTILAVVPVLAGGTLWIAALTLKGTGITRTAIGPALQYGEMLLELLSMSWFASWLGCIVSLPFVVWARARACFGWGTAMVVGVIVAILVLGTIYRFPLEEIVLTMAVPSALLGLSFWLTVRLCRPSAFRAGFGDA